MWGFRRRPLIARSRSAPGGPAPTGKPRPIEALEGRVLLSTYSLSTLGTFGINSSGAGPLDLIVDGSGNLYGAASQGGPGGDGTVFEIAHGSGTIIRIASFDGTDGSDPGGLALDSAGNLYGTTFTAGPGGYGTIFEIAHGSRTVTTRASFNGTNGEYLNPSGVALDASGNLYATTEYGGASDKGAVFELAHGSSALTALVSFNGANGARPFGIAVDSSGDLYGATVVGAARNAGNVFEIPAGSRALTSLASVPSPSGPLVLDQDGNLYGSTSYGVFEIARGSGTAITLASFNSIGGSFGVAVDGSGNVYGATGAGVFEVARGSAAITTLAPFGVADGSEDFSGVALDGSGNVYGTTFDGGASGVGRVFEVVRGSGTITTLTSFDALGAGTQPNGVALDSNGDLFGTTYGGGTSNDGTVFEIANGTRTITTLASFDGANGANARAGVIVDGNGNLYGTTYGGGAGNAGTVFELARGSATITTLATFNDMNGAQPASTLVLDSSGNLYGTTAHTVFEVAHDSATITTLASIDNNSGFTSAGLVLDAGGNLYGVTGAEVFELALGSRTITDLANFPAPVGAFLWGTLAMDPEGDLFGVTYQGGTNNDGTVFELAHGSKTIATLASFDGPNGSGPRAGVALDGNGNIYGSTNGGGASYAGTIFELPHGSGSITTLASFNGIDGQYPEGDNIVIDSSGDLYGATNGGVARSGGTVFELSASDPLLRSSTATVHATAGAPVGNVLLATFRDDDPNGTITQYSASIEWGDGDSTASYQIIVDPKVNGQFDVIASKSHAYAQPGAYPITVIINDSGGGSDIAQSTANVTPAPAVADVRVDNGSQSMSVLGLGQNLPWSGISEFDVVFNTDVTVDAADLSLSGINVPTYALGSFSYDPSSFTAHWSLSSPGAIGPDRVTADLSGKPASGVHDSNGVYLGSDDVLTLAVLPGDADGDGKVGFPDLLTVARHYGMTNAASADGDFNGDGTIGFDDLVIVARNYGRTLPPTTAIAAVTNSLAGVQPLDGWHKLAHRARRVAVSSTVA